MRRVCTVISIVLAFGVLTSSAQTIRHGVHDGGAVSRRRINRYNRADHRRSHVKSSYRWPVQAQSGHAARHVDYRRFRFWIFALDQIPSSPAQAINLTGARWCRCYRHGLAREVMS
jgi:hypothetical protein